MHISFEHSEPRETVTIIPFGRSVHILQGTSFAVPIGVFIRFFDMPLIVFAGLAWTAYFLMGFRQKCHFYSDRIRIKRTAQQPVEFSYSQICDITRHNKLLTISLSSNRIIKLDQSLEPTRNIERFEKTFNAHIRAFNKSFNHSANTQTHNLNKTHKLI